MSQEAVFGRLSGMLAGEVRTDEPMSRHTSFHVGGPAALFAVCDTLEDVANVVETLDEEGMPWTVVGKGTNLLVSDSGYDGCAIVLGKDFRRRSVGDGIIRTGAGVNLAALVQEAFRHGLEGLAFAVGIPGSFGGALTMNAGSHGGRIGDITDSVTLYLPGDGLQSMRGSEVLWGYRGSGLPERGIIVEGTLRVTQGEILRIRAEMERNFKARKETQPVGQATAGSVFLNPKGDHAGRLIEIAGLKGVRVGGARVSPVHANFIVNEGGATASDIVRLIRKIQMTVRDLHGVELRPEIRFLGSFEEG